MFTELKKYGVVPVVAVDTLDEGLKLCEALQEGGLPVAEITFRTEAAESVIREASKKFPEMIIGAGTILNPEDLKRAADAGATFAVAPGLNSRVVKAAIDMNFNFAPGVCTPSDVEAALDLGLTNLKFFPAEAAGGVPMLKSLIGPYGHKGVQFCPTGGITTSNLKSYLSIPQVAVCGGTWIAKKDIIKAGDWVTITKLAAEAVAAAKAC